MTNPLNIYVISLDNKVGNQRRDRLTYKYKWFKAPAKVDVEDFIKIKMTNFWSASQRYIDGKAGTFSSYYRLFKHIIELKLSRIIVAEDDCFLKETELELFLNNLPENITYLNGLPKHLGMSSKDYKYIPKEPGINQINHIKFRLFGTWGMYIPNYTDLIPIVERMEQQKRLTAIDIFFIKNKFINQYYYPSVFYCDEYGFSSVRDSLKSIVFDNYDKVKRNNFY